MFDTFWGFYRHEGCIEAFDQFGCTMTYEQAKMIIEGLTRYYDRVSDEEIEAHNKAVWDDINAHLYRPRPYGGDEQEEDDTPKKVPRPGYVYILAGGGYYKIGKAINVSNRLCQIEPKLPFEVEIIHTIKSENPYELESFLHEQFIDKRVNGEWFRLDEDDINVLKQIPQAG